MTPKCPDCKMDQDECICSSSVSAPEALDWLETELSAISCSYHGDPSYDHDAYWMRGRVEKLLEEARKLFTAPTPPVSEERKDAEIERLNSLVESVRSNNEALHHARDLLRSEVNKQSAALKLAREALDTISSLEASNGCILSLRECVDIAEEALAAIDALEGE